MPPEELREARDVIAPVADMRDENLHNAGKYLILRSDGEYRPDSKTAGQTNFKLDPRHPIGNPQV